MNLWLLAQEVAHIKSSTETSILGLKGLNFGRDFNSKLSDIDLH